MVTDKTLRLGALHLHTAVTGRHILERLNELNRTQWLKLEDLMKLQRDKLIRLYDYAYQYVPYYRRAFDAAGIHPNDRMTR
jgi:phenylacetate-coenzyme A ligase PaaK-like adenylate-forming protein